GRPAGGGRGLGRLYGNVVGTGPREIRRSSDSSVSVPGTSTVTAYYPRTHGPVRPCGSDFAPRLRLGDAPRGVSKVEEGPIVGWETGAVGGGAPSPGGWVCDGRGGRGVRSRRRQPPLLLDDVLQLRHQVDLHQRPLGQGRRLDRRAGRPVVAHDLGVDRVELREVGEVDHVDVDLDHIAEGAAGAREHLAEVLEDLPGFRLEAALDQLA